MVNTKVTDLEITEQNVFEILYNLGQQIRKVAIEKDSKVLFGVTAILTTVSAGDRLMDIVKFCASVSQEQMIKIGLEITRNLDSTKN